MHNYKINIKIFDHIFLDQDKINNFKITNPLYRGC